MKKHARFMLILIPLILPVLAGATQPPKPQDASMLPDRFLAIAPNPLFKI